MDGRTWDGNTEAKTDASSILKPAKLGQYHESLCSWRRDSHSAPEGANGPIEAPSGFDSTIVHQASWQAPWFRDGGLEK